MFVYKNLLIKIFNKRFSSKKKFIKNYEYIYKKYIKKKDTNEKIAIKIFINKNFSKIFDFFKRYNHLYILKPISIKCYLITILKNLNNIFFVNNWFINAQNKKILRSFLIFNIIFENNFLICKTEMLNKYTTCSLKMKVIFIKKKSFINLIHYSKIKNYNDSILKLKKNIKIKNFINLIFIFYNYSIVSNFKKYEHYDFLSTLYFLKYIKFSLSIFTIVLKNIQSLIKYYFFNDFNRLFLFFIYIRINNYNWYYQSIFNEMKNCFKNSIDFFIAYSIRSLNISRILIKRIFVNYLSIKCNFYIKNLLSINSKSFNLTSDSVKLITLNQKECKKYFLNLMQSNSKLIETFFILKKMKNNNKVLYSFKNLIIFNMFYFLVSSNFKISTLYNIENKKLNLHISLCNKILKNSSIDYLINIKLLNVLYKNLRYKKLTPFSILYPNQEHVVFLRIENKFIKSVSSKSSIFSNDWLQLFSKKLSKKYLSLEIFFFLNFKKSFYFKKYSYNSVDKVSIDIEKNQLTIIKNHVFKYLENKNETYSNNNFLFSLIFNHRFFNDMIKNTKYKYLIKNLVIILSIKNFPFYDTQYFESTKNVESYKLFTKKIGSIYLFFKNFKIRLRTRRKLNFYLIVLLISKLSKIKEECFNFKNKKLSKTLKSSNVKNQIILNLLSSFFLSNLKIYISFYGNRKNNFNFYDRSESFIFINNKKFYKILEMFIIL
ncbi:hypothetical protein (nucleomorph) [Guillardia theta]|uniref:Uncharacterized protein n=1 Tax=Guillardia theta TaxID=55529 RepID=Q98RL8_GUITH|nr:hypothetical protein GTHECHR1137 [Guillardia theta]AAK39930.1 hypothetical protein [Guillardia theta]